MKCNEKLAFGSEKRVPVQKRMGQIVNILSQIDAYGGRHGKQGICNCC